MDRMDGIDGEGGEWWVVRLGTAFDCATRGCVAFERTGFLAGAAPGHID
jgi:hypothetical protein